MADAGESTRVLARSQHGVARITLNRPEALNALDLEMVKAMTVALDSWRDDPGVRVVVLDGAGERGLCAGGDVRGLYDEIISGRPAETSVFFRAEYALNALIAQYPKPFVALADGVTMGGGIGLAGHASERVVTERSRLAMPETRIGFAPDVGGTWLLAHAPGRIGEYLGLTGESMDAADAIYAGFADHFVPSAQLAALVEALASSTAPVSELVARFTEQTAPSSLQRSRDWIDEAFSADTVRDIVERLRARSEPEASTTADALERLSPTGLAATLAGIRRARDLPDLRAALAQEYAIVMWFAMTQPDLVEGVRAQLVDKDRSPRWQPATLAELSPQTGADALAYEFAPPLWAESH